MIDGQGQRLHEKLWHLALSVLRNDGELAYGGVIASYPNLFGDGRTLFGVRIGWQPSLARWAPIRCQLLGEGGLHHFSDVGADTLWTTSAPATPDTVTGPYVGLVLGVAGRFPDTYLEWGLMLLARRDLFTVPVTVGATSYDVGGTLLGAAVTFGVRFGDPD